MTPGYSGHVMAEHQGPNHTDHIREQIYHTQEQLRHKVRVLEGEVRSVVRHTQDMVFKRVNAAQESLDIARRVRTHPLLSCVAALAVGYILGARRRTRRIRAVPADQQVAQLPENDRIMQVITPERPTVWNALATKGVEVVGEIVKRRFFP